MGICGWADLGGVVRGHKSIRFMGSRTIARLWSVQIKKPNRHDLSECAVSSELD